MNATNEHYFLNKMYFEVKKGAHFLTQWVRLRGLD